MKTPLSNSDKRNDALMVLPCLSRPGAQMRLDQSRCGWVGLQTSGGGGGETDVHQGEGNREWQREIDISVRIPMPS